MRELIGGLVIAGAIAAACSGGATTTAAAPTKAPEALTPTQASVATAAPAANVSGGGSSREALIARGKTVFETAGGIGCKTCHGTDARGKALDGGNNAPNIRGVAEQKLRDALAGGAAPMAFLKLKDEEIEAVITYLGSLE